MTGSLCIPAIGNISDTSDSVSLAAVSGGVAAAIIVTLVFSALLGMVLVLCVKTRKKIPS